MDALGPVWPLEAACRWRGNPRRRRASPLGPWAWCGWSWWAALWTARSPPRRRPSCVRKWILQRTWNSPMKDCGPGAAGSGVLSPMAESAGSAVAEEKDRLLGEVPLGEQFSCARSPVFCRVGRTNHLNRFMMWWRSSWRWRLRGADPVGRGGVGVAVGWKCDAAGTGEGCASAEARRWGGAGEGVGGASPLCVRR